MNEIKVLDQLVVFVLEICCWTGTKKLKPEDLGLTEKQLPPKELAQLGFHRLVNPKNLTWQGKYKRQAERACLEAGSRFIGGYAVPTSSSEVLAAKLNAIGEKYLAERASLLANLEVSVQKWQEENPGWEKLIRNSDLSPERIQYAISWKVRPIKVTPVGGMEEGLNEEVNALAGQVRHEIRVAAKRTWEESYKGKNEVGQKALRPLRTLRNKLNGMAFLDGELADLVTLIDQGLEGLPKSGPIKGADLLKIEGVIMCLASYDGVPLISSVEYDTTTEDTEETTTTEETIEEQPEFIVPDVKGTVPMVVAFTPKETIEGPTEEVADIEYIPEEANIESEENEPVIQTTFADAAGWF